jgi:hypothetical protein
VRATPDEGARPTPIVAGNTAFFVDIGGVVSQKIRPKITPTNLMHLARNRVSRHAQALAHMEQTILEQLRTATKELKQLTSDSPKPKNQN